jgi:DDE superfamily endonuclease
MVVDGLVAFLEVFETLRPAFTQPGFENALVIFAGWVLTNGRHAVTQALVATGVAGERHHEAFHRFFSRGTWRPDDLGRLLFGRIARLFLPAGSTIRVAIDDTLAIKKGPEVFGLGSHIDAVRSTKALRVFAFGHVWVTLSVIVTVPFSKRPWALPVLFRLYRNKKDCLAKGHTYRKKTQLAREMLDVFTIWIEGRDASVSLDSAYGNDTVLRDLPANINVVGAMRPDAVLTTRPVPTVSRRGGRPRVRGASLPKPEELARCTEVPWETCRAFLYGKHQVVYYKTLLAQWYRACGGRLLRIVIVRVDTGRIPFRVFFCTNPDLTVTQVLELYAGRWSIEVCFRDIKQLLGFAESSARKRAAVERTAPFVGYIYTTLVIWFAERIHATELAIPPIRPWYRHKNGLCFADVLRTAQRVLAPLDVLDPARSLDNLHQLPPRPISPEQPARREAA